MEMGGGVPGVVETGRVCMAFAVCRTPDGTQQVVALVGADPNVGKRFPIPNMADSAEETSPEAVLYHVRDRKQMGCSSLPAEVEINLHRARLRRRIVGYGAFLGVPFFFPSYLHATPYLGFFP